MSFLYASSIPNTFFIHHSELTNNTAYVADHIRRLNLRLNEQTHITYTNDHSINDLSADMKKNIYVASYDWIKKYDDFFIELWSFSSFQGQPFIAVNKNNAYMANVNNSNDLFLRELKKTDGTVLNSTSESYSDNINVNDLSLTDDFIFLTFENTDSNEYYVKKYDLSLNNVWKYSTKGTPTGINTFPGGYSNHLYIDNNFNYVLSRVDDNGSFVRDATKSIDIATEEITSSDNYTLVADSISSSNSKIYLFSNDLKNFINSWGMKNGDKGFGISATPTGVAVGEENGRVEFFDYNGNKQYEYQKNLSGGDRILEISSVPPDYGAYHGNW